MKRNVGGDPICKVKNLSSVRLTKAQIALISRGLQFVPVPKQHKKEFSLDAEFEEFRRKVRLRFFFAGRESERRENEFRVKSGFNPGRLKFYPEVEAFLNAFKQDLMERIKLSLRDRTSNPNLSREEESAITVLCKDRRIIIKPADKGAAVVIMNLDRYIAEGVRQLTNTTYYRPIAASLRETNAQLIRDWAGNALKRQVLTEKIYQFLLPPKQPSPRQFYLLPKIHKPPDTWRHPDMPPGRPIVTNVNTETSNLSRWLDHWLQPVVQSLFAKSLVKDSCDFLAKLRQVAVPPNTAVLLIAADVQDLYTNIPHNEAILAVLKALAKQPQAGRPPLDYLARALRLILLNNDLEFNGTVYHQIRGISMGNNCAPSIANLYMEKVDAVVRSYKPLGYWRFIDDQFWVWDAQRTDLYEMIAKMKAVDPHINITLNMSFERNVFLDVVVETKYLGLSTVAESNETPQYLIPPRPLACAIEHKVYFKPTDTHELLHGESCHPPHTFRGIVKAQVIRYRALCSRDEDFHAACELLFSVLTERAYSRKLLESVKQEVVEREKPLVEAGQVADDTVLPLVVTWNPALADLPRWLHARWAQFWQNTDYAQAILPEKLIVAWRKNACLRNRLVRAAMR